jgi:hypothetical protein
MPPIKRDELRVYGPLFLAVVLHVNKSRASDPPMRSQLCAKLTPSNPELIEQRIVSYRMPFCF